MKKLTLKDLDFKKKRVFLRVDFNVPLSEKSEIRDDTRIKASLPTINYLLGHKAKLVIASHLGRPKGEFNSTFSLKPVAQRLQEHIKSEVILAPDVVGEEVEKLKKAMNESQILLLENIRFHPGETSNDTSFSQQLAQNIDFYVNDAFGACHRAHASVVGITKYVQKAAAGLLLEKEVESLSRAIHSPKKPYVAILGGAKVSDKIPIIENLLNKADDILIGGAMAYTFLKALGNDVGSSLVEENALPLASSLMTKAREKGVNFCLPDDHIASTSPQAESEPQTLDSYPFPPGIMGLDIGPKTVNKFQEIIRKAETIFWNGPMGVFESKRFSTGTMKIAEAVASSKGFSIVGGGDSVSAVSMAGVSEKISHISTGGGASLEFIANETLPGIEALTEK